MGETTEERLRRELRTWFGHDDFRPGQLEIVRAVLDGQDTLAILPTGGGKSLTYQFPAMLLPGATLVLSPLIALMKDQVESLPPEVARRTTVLNSSLEPGEVGRRMDLLRRGQIKLVYAAPERLRQPPFLHALRLAGVTQIVVDEAHCISQWGHDFRPDYRAVGRAIEELAPRSVLAVTATATPEVADDIEQQIGRPLHRILRPTFRDNLYLASLKVSGEEEKLWATLEMSQNTEGCGLVYAGSREKCEQLARMLTRYGINAGFYHAGLPPEERAAAQDRFMSGEVRVMAATVAFGMGVDKSDIRFLIHFHPSRSLENYYQEAGRAGRDGQPSRCILLHSNPDSTNARRRLREDALTQERVRSVYQVIRQLLLGQPARTGLIASDALVQAMDGDEGLVRAALPILEEVGLIFRHGDLPSRMRLFTNSTTEEIPDLFEMASPVGGKDVDAQLDAETDERARLKWAIGQGGDFDPVTLSSSVDIALADLEGVLLSLRDSGQIQYWPGPRQMLLELLPPPPDAKEALANLLNDRAKRDVTKVDAMLAYTQEAKCRHQQIARYFGDRWPRLQCGACDVCLKNGDTLWSGKDAVAAVPSDVNPAQVALRIVGELTGGRFPFAVGKAGLVKILRGVPDAPVRPNRVRDFGALSTMKNADAERLVEGLVEQGYLQRDENDEYRRLYLTGEGREALESGDVDIEWRLPTKQKTSSTSTKSKSTAAPIDTSDADPELIGLLKDWRRGIAMETNVPPYVIFPDKTLLAIAAAQPRNEFDLLDIPGIGPARAAQYGEAIFDIIRKHCRE